MPRNANTRSLYQPPPDVYSALESRPFTAPSLTALRLWHTSTDGYVSLHRVTRRGEWRDVCSLPVAELSGHGQPWLPALLQQLVSDAYFSLAAFYRSGVQRRTVERFVPAVIEGQNVQVLQPVTTVQRFGADGLRLVHRVAESVRWLTSAYVDCDGYKLGLDGPATMAGLMRAWRSDVVPTPTLVLVSGRGAWGFWCLRDERNPATGTLPLGSVTLTPDSPVQGSSRARRLHRAVCTALAGRLAHLGADTGTHDAARVCRVPGSLHTGADERVDVLPVLADGGGLRVYTLAELADWLGLSDTLAGTRTPRAGTGTLSARQRAQRLAAGQAVQRRVHDAILALSERRGGFHEGCRHNAAYHAALAGYRAGLDGATVSARVHRLAAAMRPPLPARDVECSLRNASRKVGQGKPPKYATLAALLGMTADERVAVGLVSHPRPQPRAHTPESRRAVLRGLLDELASKGCPLPTRPVMVGLLAQRGVTVSAATLTGDYAALGVTGHTRGRPPSLPLH